MELPPNLQGIGIPFFTEAEWLAAKTVMEDGHTFHTSYLQFLAVVEQAERKLRRQGQASIRIYLRMDEFIPWCRANGRKINREARSDYAAWKAKEADGGTGN